MVIVCELVGKALNLENADNKCMVSFKRSGDTIREHEMVGGMGIVIMIIVVLVLAQHG
jgi:hypothetical protein